ncbi:MGMT family protein [Paenibacillus sp. GCM10012307]|uniref:MGMT family protein n=1 Tax=Paenibacillus roseus TaxID=2798579 RepID=A0A934J0Q6_9BACL|nr:MGMT family protein [Paenibacillus roseus]
MQPFTRNVINVIKKIPTGQVMTYGQIAAFAGSYRAARQVVRVLHSLSEKESLPWHRVVNAKGEIALSDDSRLLQEILLQGEGVEVDRNGRINLDLYQHHPD